MAEQNIPWDDLRTVLAIAESGSLSGAARVMEVSHATVFRRLGAIEGRLGVQLFERSRSGYTSTSAGEDVADTAKRVEAEVVGVERRVAGRDLLPSGNLRVTTTDTLLNGLLSPILAEFRQAYPAITVEVVISNVLLSLSKREADVAVRPAQAPPENLVGRRAGRIAQAVYGASTTFAGDEEPPDFSELDWIGPDEALWYQQLDDWMKNQGYDERCRYRVDSLLGMQSGVRDGIGVAALPCYLADGAPGLMRLGEPIAELVSDIWLLTHPDLRKVARIRAFTEFVGDAIRDREPLLAGA